MSQAIKPLIAVTGATGAQGGSVVRFLLEDGGFRVRAITRNVDSPQALALKAKGVEVVKADFDNISSLTDAFKGVDGVFGLTNYWDPAVLNEEREFEHGKALVDAAKAVGVKHFIYSTIEYSKEYKAHHFDSKARVNDYLIASQLPRTSIYTDFYFENFTNQDVFKITKTDDGALAANSDALWTDGPIPGYAVADTGAYALAAFKKPQEWIGKDIKIITEIFTPRQFVAAVEEIGGQKIVLKEVSFEAFNQLKDATGFIREVHANMANFYITNGTMGRTPEEIESARQLYPKQTTMREFIKANIEKLIPK